jgi:hypothetical protein
MKKARWLGLKLFILFICLYLLTSGGRIVSSDGNTMFLLTRAIVEEHSIAVPYGNGYPGADGRLYPKAGIGQALLSAPFYIAGRAVCQRVGFNDTERDYVMRFATASVEPFAAALAVVLLLQVCFCLGYGAKSSLALALAFGFSTPIWVYSKSFLTEPLTTALLLASVLGLLAFKRSGRRRHLFVSGLCAGMTVLVKYAMLMAVAPIVVFFLASCFPMKHRSSELSVFSGLGRLFIFSIPLVLCGIVALWYNQARFGSVLASGYGLEVSREGFGTPLLVGLFGQLFSSGKSIFLYAPVLVLSWSGFYFFKRKFAAEAFLFASIFIINALFYSKFISWAGDGSWGPRYLIPFIPLLLVPIGSLLSSPTISRSIWAVFVVLAVVGFLVQVGGVSIYFGSYLREIGEFPYKREFNDPRFLSDSHFIPNYSPVHGHWKMLARNAQLHLKGEYPRIELRPYAGMEGRIPVDEEARKELLNGLDFWFTYLLYVGRWKTAYWLIVLILGGLGTICGGLAARTLFSRNLAFA